jgi:DNA-binding NarL/FixJ family response regulator
LTAREIEVLSLIAAGNTNKLIADQLSISEDTVKGHVKSILSKLDAKDRTHAVTVGLKRGIIQLYWPPAKSLAGLRHLEYDCKSGVFRR